MLFLPLKYFEKKFSSNLRLQFFDLKLVNWFFKQQVTGLTKNTQFWPGPAVTRNFFFLCAKTRRWSFLEELYPMSWGAVPLVLRNCTPCFEELHPLSWGAAPLVLRSCTHCLEELYPLPWSDPYLYLSEGRVMIASR